MLKLVARSEAAAPDSGILSVEHSPINRLVEAVIRLSDHRLFLRATD